MTRFGFWREVLSETMSLYVLGPSTAFGLLELGWRFVLSEEQKAAIQGFWRGLPAPEVSWPWQNSVLVIALLLSLACFRRSYRLLHESNIQLSRSRERKPTIIVRPKKTHWLLRFDKGSFKFEDDCKEAFTFVVKNLGNEDAIDLKMTFSVKGIDLANVLKNSQALLGEIYDDGTIHIVTKTEAGKEKAIEYFDPQTEAHCKLAGLAQGHDAEVEMPASIQRALVLYYQLEAEKIENLSRENLHKFVEQMTEAYQGNDHEKRKAFMDQLAKRTLVPLPEISITLSYTDHKREKYNELRTVRSIISVMGAPSFWGDDLWPAMGALNYEDEERPGETLYNRFDKLLAEA